MQTFSITRFWQVLKWDIATNRNQMVKMTLVWAVILLVATIFTTNNIFGQFGEDFFYSMLLESSFRFAVTCFIIMMAVAPSLLFSEVNKNRQTRLHYLMLPGSNAEKYISRILTTFVTYVVSYVVAFLMADVAQWFISLLIHPSRNGLMITQEIFGHGGRTIFEIIDFDQLGVLASVITILWLGSLYMLGGTFFRRYAWLFVTISLIAGLTLLGSWLTRNPEFLGKIQGCTKESVLTTWSIIFGLLTTVNIGLSYWLFKRMQLINRKWINI